MYITPITPNFTGRALSIRINPNLAENKECPYLYNKVKKIVDEYKLPAIYRVKGISINIDDKVYQKLQMNAVENTLKEMGIKYERKSQ